MIFSRSTVLYVFMVEIAISVKGLLT